jgi:hypothetical protein
MTIRPEPSTSERGIALIVVLLLMAVLSGLATGFAMTGQTEVAMSTNEVYFAGARAAAEAGLNRSLVKIFADTTTDWIAGADGAVDATNASAAVNADNGSLFFKLGAGPYYVDAAHRYSFEVQILDDDNPLLYESTLSAAQLASMQEPGNSPYINQNQRVVLRAIGYGPNGTTVKIARIIETWATPHTSTTNVPSIANPAILVNGNFEMNGNVTVTGTSGHVHANGNLSKTGGSGTITGNATASGSYIGPVVATGATSGGRPTINVPQVHASDYESLATYKLAVVGGVGVVQTKATPSSAWATCITSACKGTGWSYSGGIWSSGSTPTEATYYVEGDVSIGNTSGSTNRAVSVIATGSINVQGGSSELRPAVGRDGTAHGIQFVSDGDVEIVNGSDLDDPTNVEGKIFVRGQFEAGGNMEFQGRVMVQDVANAGNLVANGANRIHGSVRFTYNGTLGATFTEVAIVSGATTYVNNVSGWMEQ